MRMNRLVTAVVSVALLGFTPVAISTTASASEPKVAQTSSAAPEARVDARAAATRTVGIGFGNRGRRAFVKGTVSPRYAGKQVIVQKGKCGANSCTWKRFKKAKTNKSSRYQVNVNVPNKGKAYYRVMVPRSGGYAVSFSKPVGLFWR